MITDVTYNRYSTFNISLLDRTLPWVCFTTEIEFYNSVCQKICSVRVLLPLSYRNNVRNRNRETESVLVGMERTNMR